MIVVAVPATQAPDRQWLAGDPHVHSKWSLDYDESKNPPVPIYTDAIYSIVRNAEMARSFGLRWMVATDHGGFDHAVLNRDSAYPELLQSRQQVPQVVQFYGLEMNMPTMDHHTVVVPVGAGEAEAVFEIERRFDVRERWPLDPMRATEAARIAALTYMQGMPNPPLVFANHPARSASSAGWNENEPRELRQSMDVAPDVYRGMEAAPGHQAKALDRTGQATRRDARGSYGRRGGQTLGGYDQMVAVLGGVWDAFLGEGRRFWITAGSDSHVHYLEREQEGDDFWPGEFQKTYVLAAATPEDIFDGLKQGRVFVTSGDLVSELDVSASAPAAAPAIVGGTLPVLAGTSVRITIRFRDPDTANPRGDNPRVARVDLIAGDWADKAPPSRGDRNASTRVVQRFTAAQWMARGDVYEIETTLPITRSTYIRVRGTNSNEQEPAMDPIPEGPWSDLWFYSNPIFIEVK
jgi:hypothetical protein